MYDKLLEDLTKRIAMLERRLELLESQPVSPHWRGTSAADFTTTTLPYYGDYGYQTTDSEVQINAGGTIRAITTGVV